MFQTSDKRQKNHLQNDRKMHLRALAELNFSITVMRYKLGIYKETSGKLLYCNLLL